ncbi:MAG: excinuclease ABC subunit UvrA [Verrucomicrobiota bacterium]
MSENGLSHITIKGARQNNLQNLDLQLPINELIVLTGVSGSGKSSLAFDTLYAEGQRRYTETFSPYTRQFLERMDKPQVDEISGIPPAVAINQANSVRTSRSTVGTITEIADYLKMLFPRMAELRSPKTGRNIKPWSAQEIAEDLLTNHLDIEVLITFSVPFPKKTKAQEIKDFLQAQGYIRILHEQKPTRLDQVTFEKKLAKDGRVVVIQDRVKLTQANKSRLIESLATGLKLGKKHIVIYSCRDQAILKKYSSTWSDPDTGETYLAPTPSLFSFNNPVGACPSCKGFGRIIEIDYQRALPDRTIGVEDGVVKPFQTESFKDCQKDLERACKKKKIPTGIAFRKLSPEDQHFIIYGEIDTISEAEWDGKSWYGVKGFFDWLETKTYKMHVRILLSKYRAYRTCPDCSGNRFNEKLNNWFLGNEEELHKGGFRSLALPEINNLPLRDCQKFFDHIKTADSSCDILLRQIRSRLMFLNQVGLGYLTLNRSTRTLSGGEVQRVNLTTCLGTSLVQTLFVLDEPSIGLHTRDTDQLIQVLKNLRDQGNTVIVVEHDDAMMLAADTLLELGPGPGNNGGSITFQGSRESLLTSTDSLTGQYLSGQKQISIPEKRRPVAAPKTSRSKTKENTPPVNEWIFFKGASHHNIQNLNVEIPLQRLVCITGVSGSGKSTLVHDVIYKHVLLALGKNPDEPGKLKSIKGATSITDALLVDQTPLAATPRSTPALYADCYDDIRSLFAMTDAAQRAGLTASAFSFNTGNGRCDRCGGSGYEKISMQFLSDLFVLCPACEGKRFQSHVLDILFEGKSIHEVLHLTISEAIVFFADVQEKTSQDSTKVPKFCSSIIEKLKLIAEVGLGYLKLGQPINNLSGGEAQRLKLVSTLAQSLAGFTPRKKRTDKRNPELPGAKPKPKNKLIILDEPTTGLHFDDIRMLLNVFQRLVDAGHTLIVIEHNLDVIKCADWVLDLGPEAGDQGGRLMAAGTPEQIADNPASLTGKYLKTKLNPIKKLGPKHKNNTKRKASLNKAKNGTHNTISITGARHHNLKDIDIDIPRNQNIVITGLSGSGKSSLAFDLLFAEGQRRYLDCLNTYARQFVEQLEKPDVDSIVGIPPSVAIEQRTTRGGRKSTVATVTEIYHFLRLLYSKLGVQHDPDTLEPAILQGADEIIARVHKELKSNRKVSKELSLLAPLIKSRKGFHKEVAKWAKKKGYHYLRVDGKWVEPSKFEALDRYREHTIDVILGNMTSESKNLASQINHALEIGKGTFYTLDNQGDETIYSTQLFCPSTGRSFDELDPRLFSYNSPHGWCPECQGYGTVAEVKLQAEDEAEREQELEQLLEEKEETEFVECSTCQGARLNAQARAVYFEGRSVPEINAMTVVELKHFLLNLKLNKRSKVIARDILPEITQRLHFLEQVGLGYLNLDRSAPTLSGGESQRIRLAAQIGSNLQGVLYVLDEPTIGLHPRDNEDLIGILHQLKDRGNSVIIVEHDEDTMRASDHIIDLGPGAGVNGGRIIAQGSWKEISKQTKSVTGTLLGNPMSHPLSGKRRSIPKLDNRPIKESPWLTIQGATANNLKGIDIQIPRQRLTVLTGVSGSGKSTLMHDVIYEAALKAIQQDNTKTKKAHQTNPPSISGDNFAMAYGFDAFWKIMEVDQAPIGKTSRSTVATYIGLMDHLRILFAQVNEAKIQGFTKSHFSFNSGPGRCQTCMGQGTIKVQMNFLPPAYIPCETCQGRRWTDPVLAVRFKDLNIYDVLELSVDEAIAFFESHVQIHTVLELLQQTGLGYLKLGQTSPTLSGGEAQRLKLVAELAGVAAMDRKLELSTRALEKKEYLYLLEEPTVGLHLSDVRRLLEIIHRLVDAGHTVIVIEHHLDVIAEADFVIDIGPEGGLAGGEIVAQGTPEQLAKNKKSHTARYLKPLLK